MVKLFILCECIDSFHPKKTASKMWNYLTLGWICWIQVSAAIKFKWPLLSKLNRKIACVIIMQMSQLCYLAWIFTEAPSSVLNYIAFLWFFFILKNKCNWRANMIAIHCFLLAVFFSNNPGLNVTVFRNVMLIHSDCGWMRVHQTRSLRAQKHLWI